MRRISLLPIRRGRRYECFDCGTELVSPFAVKRCPKCGNEDNIYLMN